MPQFGRASETDPSDEALADAWKRARQLNATDPKVGTPGYGTWVPVRTIRIDMTFQPRQRPDPRVIQQYALDWEKLPPVKVQRDSFLLIGGVHRTFAANEVPSDLIRIDEVDVTDADLADAAFEDNARHGFPLTQEERVRAAKACLRRHPDWSDQRIAEWAGVSRTGVWNWRAQLAARPPEQPEAAQPVHREQVGPSGPERRVGRDNVVRTVRTAPAPSLRPVPKPSPGAPRSRSWIEELAERLEQSPSEVATALPEEEIERQIATAEQAAGWLLDYAGALRDRQAVLEGRA